MNSFGLPNRVLPPKPLSRCGDATITAMDRSLEHFHTGNLRMEPTAIAPDARTQSAVPARCAAAHPRTRYTDKALEGGVADL